jgi:hypothetical protein
MLEGAGFEAQKIECAEFTGNVSRVPSYVGSRTSGKQYMMPKAWIKEPGGLGDAEIDIIYKSGSSPRLV